MNHTEVLDHAQAPVTPTPATLTLARETLAQFMARHKDVATAAEALANESQERFESYHAETIFQIHCLKKQLEKADSLAEVVRLKKKGDDLLLFWRMVTCNCELSLGECLIEREKLLEGRPQ